MPVATRIEEVRNEVSGHGQAAPTAKDLMESMVKLLHERMLKYNWVGFYMFELGAKPPMLALGPFAGAMTRILVFHSTREFAARRRRADK